MNYAMKLLIPLLILWLTTGCWDLTEADHLAFNLGTGLDLSKEGKYVISTQIVVPAGVGGGVGEGGGAKTESFRMMSATGRNIYDGINHLQKELPRELFLGHRKVIVIGQSLAEHGIKDFIDEIVRDPQSEMRSKLFVVKDGEAKDVLSLVSIFDPFTITSLHRQEEILRLRHFYFRDFVADYLDPGIDPMVPAVGVTSSKMIYQGSAIFSETENLKLVGFLDAQESAYVNWITGRQKEFALTTSIGQTSNNITVILRFLGRRIRAQHVGDQIQMNVQLTGKAKLTENNTDLDPTQSEGLKRIEYEVNQVLQQEIQQLIDSVQKQYRADIFGFGDKVHHQLPSQWRAVKTHWEREFSQLRVTTQLRIQCDDPGQANSSIHQLGP